MGRGNRLAFIIGGTVLALFLIVPIVLNFVFRPVYGIPGYGMWGWGMGPGMMYGFGGGWMMGIFMFIIWGLIIWGIVALVRSFGGPRRYDYQSHSALGILKARYAKGEICKEEYEDKKKALI